jgi:hypothetical protein
MTVRVSDVRSVFTADSGSGRPFCSTLRRVPARGVAESIVTDTVVARPIYRSGEVIVMLGPGSRPALVHAQVPTPMTMETTVSRMSLKYLILR